MKNNLFFPKMTVCVAALLLPVWMAAQGGMPTPIAYGESITDTINPASDVDLFTVTAMPGDILWIRVSPVSSVMNPKIEVRTPQGALFGVIVMAQSAFEMVQFIDTIPNNGGGTYTILVSDAGANNTGRFCITVDRFNSPPASDLLKCNQSITSSIGCNSSIESYRYLVQQNSISRIVVSPVNSVVDLHVWICTPDGTVIAEDSAETFEAVMIDVTAAETDCFYVFVGDTEGDNTGGFSISHALFFGQCATATIQATPTDGIVCQGSSFTLSAVTPLDNPSFLWSGPNGFASTQQTIQFANVTSSQAGTYTLNVTNPSHCSSTASATITVKPTPTIVNPPTNQTVCGNKVLAVTFSSTPPNATFNWTNSNQAIGLPLSGSGNLNFTAANVAVSETALITVAPTLNGCTGASHNFTITVNPTPTVNDPADQTVCGGAVLNVNFVGTQSNAIYNWTNSNPAIGLPATGSGNIAFTAANVASQQTGTVAVTPVLDACTGPSQNFTITVKITPTVSDPADKTACGGTSVVVPFTGTAGATYNWTNSNPAIGLPASGSGNIAFTAADITVPESAIITVTPSLNGCTGASQEFTITVNPTPKATDPDNQTVCGGAVLNVNFVGTHPNAIYNWTNSNPAIGLGASGSGNIAFTAANVASQQIGTVTVTPVLDACTGPSQNFTITVKITPTVSDPPDKTACGGTSVLVPFTGTAGATYNWTNSNPAIGLPASGSGNLNFTAANVTSQQNAIITVTPTLNGCTGVSHTFTITVNPTPKMIDPVDQTFCGGELVSIHFASVPLGATFNWTNSNPAIGLPSSGSGDIEFTAATTGQSATLTVTPTLNGCVGMGTNFTITIKQRPTMSTPADITACGGKNVAVPFTGAAGATYNWTNSNPAIGLPASGSGNLNFTAANVTSQQNAIITVTPTLNGCTGASHEFTITVNPTPTMIDPANQTVCEGELLTINFSSNPPGASFNWSNTNTAIGLAATGTGNIVFNTNDVSTLQNGTITVTPVLAGCDGPPQTFVIAVNPEPTANFSVTVEDSTATFFNSSLNAVSYLWDFGDGNDSTTPDPSHTHTYTNTGPYTVTLTVTNACGTDVFTQEIFVVVGVEDLDWVGAFNLYPNPGNGVFTVHLEGEPARQIDFELFDLAGKRVGAQTCDFGTGQLTNTLDFSHLPVSVYIMQVRAEQRAFHVKVVIQ